MREPAIPLITVNPYFLIWSRDEINKQFHTRWTVSQNAILGTVLVDGEKYCFLGKSEFPAIKQISAEINELSTTVVYEDEKNPYSCFYKPKPLFQRLFRLLQSTIFI